MNPLTLVKRIKEINEREATLGISDEASWHVKYKDSAYVFVGGIPFDLTEGDLLAVFAQYGEIVDVNLVRDKGTGKSKGFAFVAYEDQRSTNLAVDNLNGAQVLGRTIRVDHCSKYKKMEEEDEETVRQKREARGVCRAFQKGECTRGDSCKFSHDAQRAANTGWGEKEDRHTRRGNEEEGFQRNGKRPNQFTRFPESSNREGHRTHDHERDERNRMKESDRDSDRSISRRRDNDEQMTRDDRNLSHREDRKRSDYDEDIDKRGEKRGRGGYREERESRGRNGYDRKYSPSRRRNDEDREHRSSSHR